MNIIRGLHNTISDAFLFCSETSKREYETAAGVNGTSANARGKQTADADKVAIQNSFENDLCCSFEICASQPKRDKFAGLSRRAKRRKLAMEDDEGDTGAIRAAVRSAKKSSRPTPIGIPEVRASRAKERKAKVKSKAKSASVTARRGSAFERDMGDKRAGGVKNAGAGAKREGTRASKGDKIGMGKKGRRK